MSFAIAAPELIYRAATDLANVDANIYAAKSAAAPTAPAVLAAGSDDVSAAIASVFSSHGQAYQAIGAQTAPFHE